MNWLRKLALYYRTLKYVPWAQVLARVEARFLQIYYSSFLYPWLRDELNAPDKLLVIPPHVWGGDSAVGAQVVKNNFTFVGRTISMGEDIRWLPNEAAALWVFNLHYHGWLADLRAGGGVTGGESRLAARRLLEDWMEEFGSTYHPVVWHSYPLSERVVNWLTHAEWVLAEAPSSFSENFYRSLALQADHLQKNLEWDLGANHLLKNIKALIYIGLAMPSHQSVFLEGMHLLQQQLALQILPDGGHYERSPLYHTQVLKDVLDIHALLTKSGQPVPAVLDDVIESMNTVLAFYRHGDGALSLFNDSAEDYSTHLDEVADRCGAAGVVPVHLPDTGFVRRKKNGLLVMMDAGAPAPNENPGHAHAGVLSVEVSYEGERIIVNGGTYAYQHELRNYFRGTSAHSTVVVNGENSAEVWQNFRMGRRPVHVACTCHEEEGGLAIHAQHDGYKHIGVIHKRKLFVPDDGSSVLGEDAIEPARRFGLGSVAPEKVVALFHLHPKVKCQLKSESEALLTLASGVQFTFKTTGGRLYDAESKYAPQFGVLVPTRMLVLQAPSGLKKPVLGWVLARGE